MPADRNRQIEDLFHSAMQRDPEERAAFLEQACAGDLTLREEVESLLEANLNAVEGFLKEPAWAEFIASPSPLNADSAEFDSEPGLPFECLGEFRLIRRLGGGGMGVVYLAVQESLSREVALKVIRPERAGTFEAEARFRREAEAISKLRHPNIVAVFGSGEEQGVRYYAMEFLRGTGLHEVLREATSRRQRVPIRTIIGWMRDIARALACAHEAGIIHRDVKPSNIKITSEGQAVLLDFGVARNLDLSSLTLTGEFRGTPHYASPEQVKAKKERIDERTDIYSLGVSLYEAATGRVPFDGETTEQVFHQILESDPISPRRLNPALTRDLETVILKAVEKSPDRRYPTMAAFADDLQHLLDGEMITARPIGPATKLLRRFKRRPTLSATAGVGLLALIVFMLYVLWSYPQILREKNRALAAMQETEKQREQAVIAKDRAQKEAQTKEAINSFLKRMLASADPERQGKDVKVAEILDNAASELDTSFQEQPHIEATLRNTIGRSYNSLGMYEAAEEQHQKALAIVYELYGREHPDSIATLSNLTGLYSRRGQHAEAESLQSEVVELSHRVLGPDHPHTTLAKFNLCIVLCEQGKNTEAEPLLREVLEEQRRGLGEEAPDTLATMNSLALVLQEQGKLAEAAPILRTVLAAKRRTLGDDHPDTLATMTSLPILLMCSGHNAEAEVLFREVLDAKQRILGVDHPNTLSTKSSLAYALQGQRKHAEAESLLREVIEIQRNKFGPKHPDSLRSIDYLLTVLRSVGKYSEAVSLGREGLELSRALLGPNHPITLRMIESLGRSLWKQGDASAAEPLLRQALAGKKRVIGENSPETIIAMHCLACFLQDQDRFGEAESVLRRCLALAESVLPPWHSMTVKIATSFAVALVKLSRFEEAESLLLRYHEGCEEAHGVEHESTCSVIRFLIELYRAWGKEEQADQYRQFLPAQDAENH